MSKKPKNTKRTKVRYTFKETVGGILYETRVTPKMHKKMKEQAKRIEKTKKELITLKNAIAALSDGKEKEKARKAYKMLSTKNSKTITSLRASIKKREHTGTTFRANGKKIVLVEKPRRTNAKLLQGETYMIVIRLTADVSSLKYSESTEGQHISIVDSPDGATSIEEMITRRFGGEVTKNAIIVSVKTERMIKQK